MIKCSISEEKDSFEELSEIYKTYSPKLFKYMLYRVGDYSTAEDLVSEVFEKALRNYNTYNPDKGMLSTWLYTIANNVVKNYYKNSDRKIKFIDSKNIESKYQFEDLVLDDQAKEYLLDAMSHLDERHRYIIALKFGACLTNRQIALMMDLTESNVGTILYRSLKRLKDILKKR